MNANGKCTAGGRQPGKSFFRGGKNQSISPYKVICPVSQKTGQPPLVVRFLMVWVYSYVIWNMEYITYQPVPFPFYWQQTTAHCSLHIAHFQLDIQPQKDFHGIPPANRAHLQIPKIHPPPQKKFPGAGRHTVFAIPYAFAGACAGEGLGGGGPRGVCLS